MRIVSRQKARQLKPVCRDIHPIGDDGTPAVIARRSCHLTCHDRKRRENKERAEQGCGANTSAARYPRPSPYKMSYPGSQPFSLIADEHRIQHDDIAEKLGIWLTE